MRKKNITSNQLVSVINSRLVLQTVRLLQPTYRTEIAKRVNLKKPTVTGIVNELLQQNIIKETGGAVGESQQMGRPPLALEVNADYKYIAAVDLEPDCLRIVLTNIMLEVQAYREQAIDRFDEPANICDKMLSLLRDVLKDIAEESLYGIGVSLPGIIDKENGVLTSSTNMPLWKNIPVKKIISDAFDTYVAVEKPVFLAAIYERWLNPVQTNQVSLFLSIRTGIGMCLMRDGEIYIGHRDFDGEIGHTIIDLNGKKCECGNTGCLETFVSASSICQRARTSLEQGRCEKLKYLLDHGEELRPELIYHLAKTDNDCADIVRDVAYYIGIAVANMINLFGPDRIVISGSIEEADEIILEVIKDRIDKLVIPPFKNDISVSLAQAKEKSPLMGAVALLAEDFFRIPKISSLNHICST